MDIVAQTVQTGDNASAIHIELFAEKTTHILYHHHLGDYLTHQTQHLGEKVTLIVGSKLLACNAEGGAGNTSCQQVYLAVIGPTVKLAHIHTPHVPIWPVRLEAVAIVLLILYQYKMVKPCHFQPKSLTTRTSAYFN